MPAPDVDTIFAETSFEAPLLWCAFTSQISWLFDAMFTGKLCTVPSGYCRLIVTCAATLVDGSTLLMTRFSCVLPPTEFVPVVPSATNHCCCTDCEPMTE